MKTFFAFVGIFAILAGALVGFFPRFAFEAIGESPILFQAIVGLGPLLAWAFYAAALRWSFGKSIDTVERLLVISGFVLTGMCAAVVLGNIDALARRFMEEDISLFAGIATIAGGMLAVFASVREGDQTSPAAG